MKPRNLVLDGLAREETVGAPLSSRTYDYEGEEGYALLKHAACKLVIPRMARCDVVIGSPD